MSNNVQTIWVPPRLTERRPLSRALVLAFAAACALLWMAAWLSLSGPMVAAMQHLRAKAAHADAARVYLISRAAHR